MCRERVIRRSAYGESLAGRWLTSGAVALLERQQFRQSDREGASRVRRLRQSAPNFQDMVVRLFCLRRQDELAM
jgi:hypothetical protein